MKTPETKARGGADVSAAPGSAADVKSALGRLMSDITGKLQQQEERLNMLDRKAIHARRPALATAAEVEAPHQKAFEAYVRSGDDDQLRGRLPRRSADLRPDPVGAEERGVDPADLERGDRRCHGLRRSRRSRRSRIGLGYRDRAAARHRHARRGADLEGALFTFGAGFSGAFFQLGNHPAHG